MKKFLIVLIFFFALGTVFSENATESTTDSESDSSTATEEVTEPTPEVVTEPTPGSDSTEDSTSESSEETGTTCGTLIFYYMETCPYCQFAKPYVNQFESENPCISVERIPIVWEDFSSKTYPIDGVPTFVFSEENGCTRTMSGFGSGDNYETLKSWIDSDVCGTETVEEVPEENTEVIPEESADCTLIKYYYMETCSYCKKQTPVLEQLGNNKICFGIEWNLLTWDDLGKSKYGITATPTMIFINSQGCSKTTVGYKEYSELVAMVSSGGWDCSDASEENPDSEYEEIEETVEESAEEANVEETAPCPLGCNYENKCIFQGTRVSYNEAPSYCSIDTVLLPQKEVGAECQNSYECKSNFCAATGCYDIVAEIEEMQALLAQLFEQLKSKIEDLNFLTSSLENVQALAQTLESQ